MSSFPYVYGYPDNLVLVRSLIINVFNGQVRATARGTAVPKTAGLHVYDKHGEAGSLSKYTVSLIFLGFFPLR